MKPHKHAELIKAWADGAEVQVWDYAKGIWRSLGPYPTWDPDMEYRMKPQTRTTKRRLYIYNNIIEGKTFISSCKYNENHEGPHCTFMGSIEVDE